MGRPNGRKLGVYSLGLLRNRALKQALAAVGWEMVAGPLHQNLDAIGVWGGRAVAARGHRAAARRGLPLVQMEDAFLRSVTASGSEPIMGLTLDETGNYLDASCPRGDASIRLGGADASDFAAMLDAALAENPGVPIYVKRHPRALDAPELGHFTDLPEGIAFLEDGFAVADILKRAEAVYCVTSQVGFEAVLHGHIPRIFGAAFYAGWGLSRDEKEVPRRVQRHSNLSLFERVMLQYPVWFDAYSGDRTDLLTALVGLEARRRSHEIKREPYLALGMRLWKRPFVRQFLGDVRFVDEVSGAGQRYLL